MCTNSHEPRISIQKLCGKNPATNRQKNIFPHNMHACVYFIKRKMIVRTEYPYLLSSFIYHTVTLQEKKKHK